LNQKKKIELAESKSSIELSRPKIDEINYDELRNDLERRQGDRIVTDLMGNLINGENSGDNSKSFDKLFSAIDERKMNLSDREKRHLRQQTNNMLHRSQKVDLDNGRSTDLFDGCENIYLNEWPTLYEKRWNEKMNNIYSSKFQFSILR